VIEQFVIDYRLLHPGVGKEAIKPAMDHFCRQRGLKSISESTIGRVIGDLKARGKLVDPRQHLRLHAGSGRLMVRKQKLERKQRRKDYMPQQPGDLVQIDSISYVGERLKRYFVTAVDLVCGFGFAYCYPKLNSLNARDFYQKFTSVAPFTVKHIQTDNGGEFQKHFQGFIRAQPVTHFHNYPHHPQSNAHVERFNRTLKYQHLRFNDHNFDDLNLTNRNLMDYLVWFNTEKPHRSLNKLPPLRYYLNSFVINKLKSSMLWTLTRA